MTLWLHALLRSHVNLNILYISTTKVLLATKLSRMVTYLEGLLPKKRLNPLTAWSCEITGQNKAIKYPIPKSLWSPNIVEWWLTDSSHAKSYKKLWPSGLARSLDKLNHRIFTTIRYMVTKLRRMVTCYERLSPIKSHNTLIMWSSEIKWQTKPIISTLAMSTDTRLVGRWLTLRRSHTDSNMIFWSCE